MKRSKNSHHLRIEQNNGVITFYCEELGGVYGSINCDVFKDMETVTLANYIAELLHDAITLNNCSCELHDINKRNEYKGTMLEYIGYID